MTSPRAMQAGAACENSVGGCEERGITDTPLCLLAFRTEALDAEECFYSSEVSMHSSYLNKTHRAWALL